MGLPAFPGSNIIRDRGDSGRHRPQVLSPITYYPFKLNITFALPMLFFLVLFNMDNQ